MIDNGLPIGYARMRIEDFIAAFASEWEMNYSIHIAPTHGFIYFSNPKAACTTVKGSLNLSLAAATGRSLVYASLGDVHDRGVNLLQSPAETGYATFLAMVADPAVLKLSIIRDPVSRFCSAYANKIAHHGDIYVKFLEALPAHHGLREGMDIPVKQFARMVAGDAALRDIDEHWRLQTRQICLDLVPGMWMGRHDTVEHDLRAMLSRVFGPDHVYFDALKFNPENASGSAEVRATLDEEDLANIRAAYAEDYARLPLAPRERRPQ